MEQRVFKVPDIGDLYRSPCNPRLDRIGQGKQPLTILFTWMGASEKAIRKYVNLYTDKGVDCLVIPGYLYNFLRPPSGMQTTERLLNYLIYEQDKYDKYFVHAFSIGAFMLSLCAVHIRKNVERFGAFQSRLRAVIMDSSTIGSLENMAEGIGKGVSNNPFIRWMYNKIVMLFFKMSPSTVNFYDDTVSLIFSAPFNVPSLFYYSLDDPLSNSAALTKLTNNWKKQLSSPVVVKGWEKSVHSAHLIFHRDEYLQTFKEFCELVPNLFPSQIEIVSKL